MSKYLDKCKPVIIFDISKTKYMNLTKINNERIASLGLKSGSTFLYADTTVATVKYLNEEEIVFTMPSHRYPGQFTTEHLSVPQFLSSIDYYKTITNIKA